MNRFFLCVARLFFSFAVLLALAPHANAQPAVPQVLGGSILTDTVLTLAQSPFQVASTLTVESAATLTIEPGVVLEFASGAGLVVLGGLEADARPDAQVVFRGSSGSTWAGIQVVQPLEGVELRSATVRDAVDGLTIRQVVGGASKVGAVTVRESLFTNNQRGLVGDYTVSVGAPKLSIKDTLFAGNGVGIELLASPANNVRPQFNHNSFDSNGIGLRVASIGQIKLKQQWWGSTLGPLETCTSQPLGRSDRRDAVCGATTSSYTPWANKPAGRVLLPAGVGSEVETSLGTSAAASNDTTSLLTLSIPEGAIDQNIDLTVSGNLPDEIPAGQGVAGTSLGFEITAIGDDGAVHTFENGKQLVVQITYELADLNGLDPATLGVLYFDEQAGVWRRAGVSTSVDGTSATITARLDHLTRFSVRSVNTFSDIYVPLVQQ